MKKILLIASMLFIPFLFMHCSKSNTVITTPAYAIGTIVYYDNGKSVVQVGLVSVGYSYIVAGEQYGNNYTSGNWGSKWAVPTANYSKGDMFMVEYESGCNQNGTCNKAKASRMLFNYPVHDSADYNNYVLQFATTPPTP